MKRVVILILTLAFLAVLYYALTTTSNAFGFVDVKKEGFSSAAPTRASDCNCLPGYIPSKKSSTLEGFNGNLYNSKNSSGRIYLFFNPEGSNILIEIQSDGESCGLPYSGNFPYLNVNDIYSPNPGDSIEDVEKAGKKYLWGGVMQPFMCGNRVKKTISKNTNTQETFFCQRLGDPSSRRECY